jgi:hypothetical protein
MLVISNRHLLYYEKIRSSNERMLRQCTMNN